MDGRYHADYTTKLPFNKPQIYLTKRSFKSLPIKKAKKAPTRVSPAPHAQEPSMHLDWADSISQELHERP